MKKAKERPDAVLRNIWWTSTIHRMNGDRQETVEVNARAVVEVYESRVGRLVQRAARSKSHRAVALGGGIVLRLEDVVENVIS